MQPIGQYLVFPKVRNDLPSFTIIARRKDNNEILGRNAPYFTGLMESECQNCNENSFTMLMVPLHGNKNAGEQFELANLRWEVASQGNEGDILSEQELNSVIEGEPYIRTIRRNFTNVSLVVDNTEPDVTPAKPKPQ
jgi:hypothetical protein